MHLRPPPGWAAAEAADLAAAGLVFSTDADPGYRRRRHGRGFVYLDERGRRVDDPAALARIRALAVPPAYRDVWICADPCGHMQASARDARGRKQYRYHPAWRALRDEVKFDRLVPFGEALPGVRRRLAEDLALAGTPREKVLAAVVTLLQTTLIRVGNEEYARANGSYGLTTLRNDHVRVEGSEVRFVFRGKSGREHRVGVRDRRLASVVRRCEQLPGQHLFQYVDGDGALRAVESGDVNAYLRELSHGDFTAKDFRTWMATLLAATVLATTDVPHSQAEARRAVRDAVEATARRLGNTPTVARTSYIHPAVLDAYASGELAERWAAGPSRPSRWLVTEERRLLAVLRRLRATPGAGDAAAARAA